MPNGAAAGDHREVGILDLERQRARHELLLVGPTVYLQRQLVERCQDIDHLLKVVGIGLLGTERLAHPLRLHLTVVNSPRKMVVGTAHLPELTYQVGLLPLLQILSRMNTQLGHTCGSHPPHPEELVHRQLLHKRLCMLRFNHEEAIRLPVVGGNLCKELVVGDTGGSGEACAVVDLLLDLTGDKRGGTVALVVDGDIEKRLVERERLHLVGILEEDLHDLAGDGAIVLKAGHDEDQVGTLAQCRDGGHGGMNAILPCLIAGSSHHAPFASVAHGDWFATIIGIVALLDGGVKRIHIHMDDLPVHKGKYNGNLLHVKGKGNLSLQFVEVGHGGPKPFNHSDQIGGSWISVISSWFLVYGLWFMVNSW